MARQIAQQKVQKRAVDVPKEKTRQARLVKGHDSKKPEVDAKEDVIGVKVIDVSQAPDPRTINKNLAPMEEEKKVENEGAIIAELEKKKALANKKARSALDEDAFTLFIYRVLKE